MLNLSYKELYEEQVNYLNDLKKENSKLHKQISLLKKANDLKKLVILNTLTTIRVANKNFK